MRAPVLRATIERRVLVNYRWRPRCWRPSFRRASVRRRCAGSAFPASASSASAISAPPAFLPLAGDDAWDTPGVVEVSNQLAVVR